MVKTKHILSTYRYISEVKGHYIGIAKYTTGGVFNTYITGGVFQGGVCKLKYTTAAC